MHRQWAWTGHTLPLTEASTPPPFCVESNQANRKRKYRSACCMPTVFGPVRFNTGDVNTVCMGMTPAAALGCHHSPVTTLWQGRWWQPAAGGSQFQKEPSDHQGDFAMGCHPCALCTYQTLWNVVDFARSDKLSTVGWNSSKMRLMLSVHQSRLFCFF